MAAPSPRTRPNPFFPFSPLFVPFHPSLSLSLSLFPFLPLLHSFQPLSLSLSLSPPFIALRVLSFSKAGVGFTLSAVHRAVHSFIPNRVSVVCLSLDRVLSDRLTIHPILYYSTSRRKQKRNSPADDVDRIIHTLFFAIRLLICIPGISRGNRIETLRRSRSRHMPIYR